MVTLPFTSVTYSLPSAQTGADLPTVPTLVVQSSSPLPASSALRFAELSMMYSRPSWNAGVEKPTATSSARHRSCVAVTSPVPVASIATTRPI